MQRRWATAARSRRRQARGSGRHRMSRLERGRGRRLPSSSHTDTVLLTSGFFSGGKDSGGWKAGKTMTTETLRARRKTVFEEKLPFSVISVSLWSGFGSLFWLRQAEGADRRQ